MQVEPITDFAGRFSPGGVLFLQDDPYRVEYAHSGNDAWLLLKLEGIDSPEDARPFRGQPMFVPRESVPSLPQGEYYYFQLLDMQVYTPQGDYLGRISEIMQTGSNDVYVVTDGDRETLVPALDDVIRAVNVEGHRMVVDLPEGLR